MRDIKNPKVICAKGLLFLAAGILAGGILLVEQPTLKSGSLLAVTIWAFCRFYYFAFYVISRYVDASYRYSGLLSLIRHALRKPRGPNSPPPERTTTDDADL